MNNLDFLEMVLGFDPQQKIMIVLGFLYHDVLLNALSLRPQSTSGAIAGLSELTAALGLIGFIVLVLNRSLWNVKTILSWLVITLLVVLGARGDVLYLELSSLQQTLSQSSLAMQQRPSGTIQTTAALAVNPSSVSNTSQSNPQQPTPAFPTYSRDILNNLGTVQNDAKIGGFTPIVLTLYGFNRLNLLLLTTLKVSSLGEITKRMEKVPDIMFREIVSPSARAQVDTYVQLCGRGETLRLDQEMLKKKNDASTKRPVYDTLKDRTFTYVDLQKANNAYLASNDPNVKRYTFPYFGNDPDESNYMKLNQDAQDLMVTNESAWWGETEADDMTGDIEKLVQAELLRRSGGPMSPNANVFINANAALLNSPGLDVNKPIGIMTLVPKSGDEFSDKPQEALSLFQASCWAPVAVAGVSGLSYADCKSVANAVAVTNCAEFHDVVRKSLIQSTQLSALEKEAMDGLVAKAIETGLTDAQGNPIIDVTALNDTQLATLAVLDYNKAQGIACSQSAGGISGAKNTWLTIMRQSTDCDNANDNITVMENMLRAKAIRGTTAFYERLYKSSYDPSGLFVSDFRDLASDLGNILGPVVLWFGALFGGFGAGSYGGIVPQFMAFIIGFIIAVAPLMFVVGLLMPGWAFGILLTPVGVVAYMKMVEVMFTVVTSIFAMFKTGVTSEWVSVTAENDTFFNLQQSIYDIVVGLAYTSMFGIAGYVMFSMGNPGALMGAIKAIDGQAKIEFKDVLAAYGAVRGATALAKGAAGTVAGAATAGYKGIKTAEFAAGQVQAHGLGKGLSNTGKALFGSMTQTGQQHMLNLQGRVDAAEGTSDNFKEMGKRLEREEQKRKTGLSFVDDQQADDAKAKLLQKRRETKKSKEQTEDALRGANQADEVDSTRYNRQIEGGGYVKGDTAFDKVRQHMTNAVMAELEAGGMSKEAVADMKAEIQKEVDKLIISSVDSSVAKGAKFIDDKDKIDYAKGEVEVSLDLSHTAEGRAFMNKYSQYFTNAENVANHGFTQSADGKNFNFKYKLATGATKANSAATGQTPTAGRRTFTEQDAQEAKDKADKNNWELDPKS